jgi:hypothetical protein
MKNRLLKNWKTTLVGIILLMAGLVFVAIGKATLTEYAAIAPLGFTLLFLKDPKLKNFTWPK